MGLLSLISTLTLAGERQVQEFSLNRTLTTDQVIKFSKCFDLGELEGAAIESINLDVRGLDKESFLELIIDGYPTGRTFDVKRGEQQLTIPLEAGHNRIGVDFNEVSLVVRGELYIGSIRLILRKTGDDHDRPRRPGPGHGDPLPPTRGDNQLEVDHINRYLPADVSVDFDEILAGRDVYTHDYPTSVTLFLETGSVSSISFCQHDDLTHNCENKLLRRGTVQAVNFEVPGPFTISDLFLIGRGIVKIERIIFHFE